MMVKEKRVEFRQKIAPKMWCSDGYGKKVSNRRIQFNSIHRSFI